MFKEIDISIIMEKDLINQVRGVLREIRFKTIKDPILERMMESMTVRHIRIHDRGRGLEPMFSFFIQPKMKDIGGRHFIRVEESQVFLIPKGNSELSEYVGSILDVTPEGLIQSLRESMIRELLDL